MISVATFFLGSLLAALVFDYRMAAMEAEVDYWRWMALKRVGEVEPPKHVDELIATIWGDL